MAHAVARVPASAGPYRKRTRPGVGGGRAGRGDHRDLLLLVGAQVDTRLRDALLDVGAALTGAQRAAPAAVAAPPRCRRAAGPASRARRA